MSATTLRAEAPVEDAIPAGASMLHELWRRPTGVAGLMIIVALLVVFVAAPFIAPYDQAAQDVSRRLEAPSRDHLLGTDHLGRDVLSRLLLGTRIALGTAFPAISAALVGGLILGLLAGYVGGWVDNVLLVVLDTIQAFPTVILILALLALLGPSLRNMVLVIAVTRIPGYARIVRAQVLALKNDLFIEVERSLGAGALRILLVHVVPNILAPLVILLAMDLPGAVTTEAGLSFLGLGVKPPTPSWGVILSDGFAKIRNSPWPVVWASLALMVTTLGFTLFGEAMRDILDPRLAGTRRG